ncbi:MAG: transglutaminase domain-containing protein [Alphaproteobacteria bacterium]
MGAEGTDAAPRIFHAVRAIPYGSTGHRDPLAVLDANRGSCSGKHILLRDLLRTLGCEAETETVFTHFNKGVPDHPDMPDALRRMLREGEVWDYHHYVALEQGGARVKLDATWHDALIPFGFPVNHSWSGRGDTRLAAEPVRAYGAHEDVIDLKRKLIAALPAEQRRRRERFLRLLTDWMAHL